MWRDVKASATYDTPKDIRKKETFFGFELSWRILAYRCGKIHKYFIEFKNLSSVTFTFPQAELLLGTPEEFPEITRLNFSREMLSPARLYGTSVLGSVTNGTGFNITPQGIYFISGMAGATLAPGATLWSVATRAIHDVGDVPVFRQLTPQVQQQLSDWSTDGVSPKLAQTFTDAINGSSMDIEDEKTMTVTLVAGQPITIRRYQTGGVYFYRLSYRNTSTTTQNPLPIGKTKLVDVADFPELAYTAAVGETTYPAFVIGAQNLLDPNAMLWITTDATSAISLEPTGLYFITNSSQNVPQSGGLIAEGERPMWKPDDVQEYRNLPRVKNASELALGMKPRKVLMAKDYEQILGAITNDIQEFRQMPVSVLVTTATGTAYLTCQGTHRRIGNRYFYNFRFTAPTSLSIAANQRVKILDVADFPELAEADFSVLGRRYVNFRTQVTNSITTYPGVGLEFANDGIYFVSVPGASMSFSSSTFATVQQDFFSTYNNPTRDDGSFVATTSAVAPLEAQIEVAPMMARATGLDLKTPEQMAQEEEKKDAVKKAPRRRKRIQKPKETKEVTKDDE